MRALAFSATALTLLAATSAWAQPATVTTLSGRIVQLGYYSFLRNDCSGGATPRIRVPVPPQHGQLIVKSAVLTTKRLPQCGTVKAPTDVVFYKSSRDFVGADPVSFEVFNTDTQQSQRVTVVVNVTAAADKI